MKSKMLCSAVFILSACGTQENSNELVDLKPAGGQAEDGLHLADSKGYLSLRGQLENAKAAFDSVGMIVRKDESDRFVRKCSGAYAYEVDLKGVARLFFYTAAHCVENRNPLGTVVRDGMNDRLRVQTLVHNKNSRSKVLERFVIGEAEGYRFNVNTNFQGERSDIARYFIRVLSSSETSNYLPVCGSRTADLGPSIDSSATGKQVISARRDLGSLGWRNFSDAAQEVPWGLKRILNSANATPYRIALGIEPRPGDSGSPVFVFDHGKNGEIKSYRCLKGIVTRESWLPRGKCKRGDCRLEGNMIYERIMRSGLQLGSWGSF